MPTFLNQLKKTLARLLIFLLVFVWIFSGWLPLPKFKVPEARAEFVTSGTTWAVPANWDDNNNYIEVIGGGGAGVDAAAGKGSGGGGGGAYSKSVNVNLPESTNVGIHIASGGTASGGGGGDTFLCNSTANCGSILGSAVVVGAQGAATTTLTTAGVGGASASGVASGTGFVKTSGGNGGTGYDAADSGGGGGGAGSAAGTGKIGGDGSSVDTAGGAGGGGGAGGASATNGSAGTTTAGGAGGTGPTGTAGGTGGNGSSGNPGSNGSGGGGSENGTVGGAGGGGQEWDSTHGSGGGGGGGSNSDDGGAGGLYGGGGGGGETGLGTGGAGIIVITYTPIVNSEPTITSVTDYPDPINVGNTLTFSVDWNDTNVEGVKLYICKAADGGTSGCGGGGTWCSYTASYSTTDPLTCTDAIVSEDGTGLKSYYAYVCDDEPSCSGATAGSFIINGTTTSIIIKGGIIFLGGMTIK